MGWEAVYRVAFRDDELGLTGFLVVDRVVDGLCGGGLRIAPTLQQPDLERLARLMTLKYAAMGVRIGGAKSGIVADRGAMADDRAIRRTAELLEPFLRSIYLVGEDVGTRGADVAAIYDHIGLDPIEFVAGKMGGRGVELEVPEGLDVSDLMDDSFAGIVAGHGVAHAALAATEVKGLRMADLRVAVQGFGSVGRAAAAKLAELGASVVAVADADGTLYAPRGLDVAELEAAVSPLGLIDRAALRQPLERLGRDEWCTVDAEVLVPAAVEHAITLDRLDRLSRRVAIVVEGANSPVDQESEIELERNGVAVVPDFIANAGSAVAFGLLIVGEADLENVFPRFLGRIEERARAVLTDAALGSSARERAIALAHQTLGLESRRVEAAAVP